MVQEMLLTEDDKAIPWTALTSKRSKTELYLPAGFPSLERTLFGGGLRMACSLLNSKRSLEERSSDLGR